MKKTFLIAAVCVLALLFVVTLGLFIFLRLQSDEPTTPVTESSAMEVLSPEPTTPVPEAQVDSEQPPYESEPPVYSPDYTQRALELLGDMTLHEKIAQMMIVTADVFYSQEPVGGVIFLEAQIQSRQQISNSITNIQTSAEIDLFICADEEGGSVTRIMNNLDTTVFEAMFTYKDLGGDTARSNAETIASDMKQLGFNLDLAPVADVWSNPENTVIGDRAYSDSFLQAQELIPYAVQGFHDGGIACCLKHFPGHGDTFSDTHYTTAVVSKTKEELMQNELLPFISGIEAGADMVMIGHLTMTAIDQNRPATLSANVVEGLLRAELGYEGVVITDGLGMDALAGYTDAEIAVMAVQAGNDILLGPNDLNTAISAIEEAVNIGTITEERINESVIRILKLKLERGIIN